MVYEIVSLFFYLIFQGERNRRVPSSKLSTRVRENFATRLCEYVSSTHESFRKTQSEQKRQKTEKKVYIQKVQINQHPFASMQGQKPPTKALHASLSWASRCNRPHDRPISLISDSTLRSM
jgi:hypothetical protein